MIALVGLCLFGVLACVAAADGLAGPDSSSALTSEPTRSSGTLDALLFLLCLVGVVGAHIKRKRDDDDF